MHIGNHTRSRAGVLALLITTGALLVASAPAGATLASFAPVDPATGFPASYTDAAGLSLDLCLDGPPNCIAATADLVGAAPDGEAFYWLADAEPIPSPLAPAATLDLRLGLEAAFAGGAPDGCLPGACDEITFSRIRFSAGAGALVPGATYTVTHPFGTDTFVAGADGGVANRDGTEDIGCAPLFPAVCAFGDAMASRLGPFLTWDTFPQPSAAGGPPDGFIGDPNVAHAVIGSPFDTNFFKVEGEGLPAGGVISTAWTLQGKVSPPAGPAAPKLTFVPGSQAFGTQRVDTASAPRVITVHSSGSADLNISAIALTGAGADQFSIAFTTCGAPPTTLAQQTSCTVGLNFVPTTTGAKSAALTITDDASGSPHNAPLSGTAVASQLSASPASVDFLNQLVPTTSLEQFVTITNPGNASLTISSTAITGAAAADFAISSSTCNAPVAIGGSCSVGLRFAPSAAGARNATLALTSDALGGPHTVALTGNGTVIGLPPGPAPVVVTPAGGGGGAAAAAPAPAAGTPAGPAAEILAPASKLALKALRTAGRVKRSSARRQGIRLLMDLAEGTKLVKVNVYRRSGATLKLISSAVRTTPASGPFTVRQNGAILRRLLRVGSYEVQVTPGRSTSDLGSTTKRRFKVVP